MECIRETASVHIPYWKSLRVFGTYSIPPEWEWDIIQSAAGPTGVKEKKYFDNSEDFEPLPGSHDQPAESHDQAGDVGGASGKTDDSADVLLSNLREVAINIPDDVIMI